MEFVLIFSSLSLHIQEKQLLNPEKKLYIYRLVLFDICCNLKLLMQSTGCSFTFSHLADAFMQSDLQIRAKEAIKINKRAMIHKCYNKSVSLTQYT